jgi:cytochrome c-type biogenesis protein CcmH/NrfF
VGDGRTPPAGCGARRRSLRAGLAGALLSLALVAADPAAVEQVARQIHPPSCPPNLAADSCPSDEAAAMRERIARLLDQGLTPQQVLDRFVADYGPQVLEAPTRRGFDLLAWVLPGVGVAAGFALLAAVLRGVVRRRVPHPPGPPRSGPDGAEAHPHSEGDQPSPPPDGTSGDEGDDGIDSTLRDYL